MLRALGRRDQGESLGRAKCAHKPLRITWHKLANGNRVATLVAVDLSHG